MRRGVSFSIFPTSWEAGYVKIRRKRVWAFGPFRFSIHRVSGSLQGYKNES